MEHNRTIVAVALVVVGLVAAVAVGPRLLGHHPGAGPDLPAVRAESDSGDRSDGPVIGGLRLAPVSSGSAPPAPAQWAGGSGGIPTNTWWSSAVTGPGAEALWPQPLALRIAADGRVEVAAPELEERPDGSSEAPFVPALSFTVGAAARTTVTGSGPLHVTIVVEGEENRVELTLVQGSPLVELTVTRSLRLTVPGARPDGGSARTIRVAAGPGPWVVAGDPAGRATAEADAVAVTPGPTGRFVVGPVPADADDAYDRAVEGVVAHPLLASEETLAVADDGRVTQVLRQVREGGGAALWALRAHHQRGVLDPGPTLGTLAGPDGSEPVVAGAELRVGYPAVPILWSAVPAPDAPTLVPGPDVDPTVPVGSYFGGKAIYAAAARSDALAAAGDATLADEASAGIASVLGGLGDEARSPSLRWDDRWGSVVLEPTEFGAGTDLNDHQLQYGYWVAAAAHQAERDPDGVAAYREAIDLLVADYAGTDVLDGVASALPGQRTWSPYEGHSWASGTAPFAAGNNLESVSESSLAWWAAARWLLATDRSAQAEPFIARLTIETALTGDRWLPQGDRLPAGEARPWSGVVWSGKSDLTTWFDPAPESALGIRLLPVGPAGLARYGSPDAIAAAEARWAWCDDHAAGCTSRWADLLGTDAVVAGRDQLDGPSPEASTPPLLLAWWRQLWTTTTPAFDLSCSVGAVARTRTDGAVVVLASSPAPEPTTLSCRDAAGRTVWSDEVQGTAAVVVEGR